MRSFEFVQRGRECLFGEAARPSPVILHQASIILKSTQALNLTQLHTRLPLYLADPQVQCVVDRFLRMVIMLAHLHANAHKYVVGYSRCVNKMVSMET